MDKPLELPDVYEVRQGHALEAAVKTARETGDMGPVLKIVDHIAAEGDQDREFVLALALFRHQLFAIEAGDESTMKAFGELMQARFSPEILDQVMMFSMLTAGLRQGWLPADDYDKLSAYLADKDAGLHAQLDKVERRAA
ncbi:hypothetical protein [Amycolatopsis japonica]|uniref:hypothetical protein n=1 Tax=Amycolatopsis japonica TaxID=208439 RepID=UPI00058A155A|nr:hypothetical protein [Amycolatopsis japonica]